MRILKGTRLLREMFESSKSTIIQRGGARSGKSHSILMYLIYKLTNEKNTKILISRKTLPALRATAMKVFVEMLKEIDYYKYCEHSLSYNTIVYKPTSAFVSFSSIDNPDKIMSTEWNYIFLEEMTEFKFDDYVRLQTRLSAPTKTVNQLIGAFNPVSALHWIKSKVINVDSDLLEIVSTYKDNPFLSETYIQSKLLPLKNLDKNLWKVFGEGQWGNLEDVIYNNYEIVNFTPRVNSEVAYGLDFGFNAPSALIKIKEIDEQFYLTEKIYTTKMTNSDLIWKMKGLAIGDNIIYCDSAEPQRIEELRRAGFNVRSANKSVKDGIDFVKRKKLFIHKNSLNLIKEIGAYTYRKDSNGNVLDEPVKFNDHLCMVAGTKIDTINGKKNIENIIIGDLVLTRFGYKHVIDSQCTGIQEVKSYNIDNNILIMTPDHRLITNNGKVCAKDLTTEHILYKLSMGIITSCVINLQHNTDGILKKPVYNITVKDSHEYFANNILVANCDGIRYCMYSHWGNKQDFNIIAM